MTLFARVPAACAALAVLSPALSPVALAADYDPPIYVEEAPEFVPVEVGSGWYLRGDIAYNAGNPVYDISHPNLKHDRFGGGIGVGYHFSDNFRADVTATYLGKDEFAGGTGAYKAWSGLVSGYYDIATIVGVTPYVGAGVGLTYSHNLVPAASVNERGYDFAYALMAGASYKATDDVSVDLGYQFLHAPDGKYYDFAASGLRDGTRHHQLKVGLRYDLW